MIRKTVLAGAVAAVAFMGSALSARTIDLGFIMDRSGSVGTDFAAAMDALGDALANNIPTSGSDTYRISVVSFASSASVVVGATTINSQTDLNNVVNTVKAQNAVGSGATNYQAALDLLGAQFGSLGDLSLINMMTDGQPNLPSDPTTARAAAKASATTLQNAGWDSLSFESVCDATSCTTQNNFLASMGFGPGNTPNDAALLPIYTSAAQIGDPATTPFVLDLPSFAAYNSVIDAKVAKIVNPIPVPAALPLLFAGLGVFAFVGRRRRQAA
ncbi:VWA domain-containing protein [Sedimentitalea sp. HM32M-2]|uniref:VWA domain-containing protein n=1 Tax=Sedimentitalea sp. HM32M-2 TaxID=3351566 RepID=UPI003638AEA5